MCIIDVNIIITCLPVQQIHNGESQEAFEDSAYFRKIRDKSVGYLYTLVLLKKEALQFLLFIKSSS